MISSLAQTVMRCLARPVSATQLMAPLMVALLLLSPFTPFSSVVIAPAKADKVQDCVNSIAAAADLAKTVAQDTPGLAKCTGQIASGDLVMAAITVIIAGYGAAHRGSFGSGDQVDACKAKVDGVLVNAIVAGLKAIAASGGASAVDALFGGADNADKAFAALAAGGGSELANLPGISQVLDEANCGCSIVAGAIDIAKATVDLEKDAKACSEILFDYAAEAGKAIGSGFYAVGEYVECGLNPGACSAGDGTFQNVVYGSCHAGEVGLTLHVEYDVDQVHGTVEKDYQSFDCNCPSGTYQASLSQNTMACKCSDSTKAYNGSSCQSCAGYPDRDGTCHVCPPQPGLVAFGNDEERKCRYKPMCGGAQAYDAASNSCVSCPANSYSDVKPVIDGQGDNINPGQCKACEPGQFSAAGATSCSWLNCSLMQQVSDKEQDGGHSCVTCKGSIVHRLDADVCVDAKGNAMHEPQTCAWGSNLTLGDGTVSQTAYNTDDCKPVCCQGTDHIAPDGYQCMKCQNIETVPVSLSGLRGDKVISKGGKKGNEATMQVCRDPPVTQPKPVSPKIPGLQVEREKPDLQFQQIYDPRPAIPSSLLGTLGNNGAGPGPGPDPSLGATNLGTALQGGAAATGMPQAVPGRQPTPPPPPGGGTGHTVPAEGDKSYSSHSDPAQGGVPTSTGPARTKGKEGDKDKGPYTTVTVPVEPDTPTSTGPARTKGKDNGKDKGPYTTVTVPAESDTPTSTGPARNAKKDGDKPAASSSKGEGYKIAPMGSGGDGTSAKSGVPQLHPTPGLSNGQPLRPSLNDEPQMRMTPRLNDSPQLRATPQLNPTPQAGRAPSASGNTTQPERIRPTLNDSRSGPVSNSGTGAPTNPFAR